ncbi:uncharacterized protein LOC121871119 isoform X2 [Homarus americanus]|uniref:uncharacterized protein LOC121871119 isoform X2 n=1 Tax=Homarus americanus TaxID=6706 RepID=UPI001C491925|nr:uncharacterized protein LOC121871119 isoform X2 [Homarus americanus]
MSMLVRRGTMCRTPPGGSSGDQQQRAAAANIQLQGRPGAARPNTLAPPSMSPGGGGGGGGPSTSGGAVASTSRGLGRIEDESGDLGVGSEGSMSSVGVGGRVSSLSYNSRSWSEPTSRRSSQSYINVSVDDRRQLFSAGKLNVESGMSAYGSIAYQMRDANMDSNNTCEFVYKALKVISKTVLMTVLLVISITVPVLMVIMGVQYLNDCPLEPNIPIYLLVGGCFGTLKLLWMLCQQVRSRRYERIDDAFAEDSLDEIFTSTSYRATDVALTIFLLIWFGMGNYWVYKIYLPNFHVTLFQPNDWCSKTVYLFAVAQLFFVYAIVGFFIVVAFCLACGQKCVMLFGESYK